MCCCCHPETNWYDGFDGTQLNRCYWLRRVSYIDGVFGDRFYRPDNSSRYALSDSAFAPPTYYIDHPSSPHTQQRNESLYRPVRFFKDADFEIYLEIGVENFSDPEHIDLYFANGYFRCQYLNGIRRMDAPGGLFNWEYVDSSPPTSFTLGWKIQIFGASSSPKWAMRYYFDGVEQTDWFYGQVAGSQKAYGGYEYHRDHPQAQHIGAEFSTLTTPDSRVFCRYSHFKLTSQLL